MVRMVLSVVSPTSWTSMPRSSQWQPAPGHRPRHSATGNAKSFNSIVYPSSRLLAELNYSLQHSSSSSLILPLTNGPGVGVAPGLGPYGNVNRRQAGHSLGNMPGLKANHRSILVTYPINTGALSGQLPLMNSPSSGNILHVSSNLKILVKKNNISINKHLNSRQQIV